MCLCAFTQNRYVTSSILTSDCDIFELSSQPNRALGIHTVLNNFDKVNGLVVPGL